MHDQRPVAAKPGTPTTLAAHDRANRKRSFVPLGISRSQRREGFLNIAWTYINQDV